jgi:hypothetical protein
VYDDAIWITDNSVVTDANAKPSGLAVLSPYTGHPQWIRYAELVNDASTSLNWPGHVGMERTTTDKIYRVSPTIITSLAVTSGRVAFQEYDDMLDYTGETLNTSTIGFGAPNEFPLGGDPMDYADMCFDGTSYWVTNAEAVGFDVWRFDSTFEYTGQFIVVSPDPAVTGTHDTRMAFVDGDLRVFFGRTSIIPNRLIQSGIYTVGTITAPTEIAGGTAPDGGELILDDPKPINGAPFFGVRVAAEIFDLFEVSGGTHVPDGIYCLIRLNPSGLFANKDIYLLRIVESTDTWEIAAIYELATLASNLSFVKRFEMLTMPI